MKSRTHPMLWAVTDSSYVQTVAMPSKRPDSTHYLPELHRRATLGVNLFASMSDARRAAMQNLERIAAEHGVSVAEMAVRLRDAAEAARRVTA